MALGKLFLLPEIRHHGGSLRAAPPAFGLRKFRGPQFLGCRCKFGFQPLPVAFQFDPGFFDILAAQLEPFEDPWHRQTGDYRIRTALLLAGNSPVQLPDAVFQIAFHVIHCRQPARQLLDVESLQVQ